MFFLRRRRFYIGHQDRSLRTIFLSIPYLFCVIMRAKCMVTDAEIRRSK